MQAWKEMQRKHTVMRKKAAEKVSKSGQSLAAAGMGGVVQGYFTTSMRITRDTYDKLVAGMKKKGISGEKLDLFSRAYFSEDTDEGDLDAWLIDNMGYSALQLINIANTDTEHPSRLMVGEGTFGFSYNFAMSHREGDRGADIKIIPSAYERRGHPIFKNDVARKRIRELQRHRVPAHFGVDATKLHENPKLMRMAPTQVQFNCPRINGRVRGLSNKMLIGDFLESVLQMPSVDTVYIALPTSASYDSAATLRRIYGRHFSFEFVQSKVKPGPYDEYDFEHEMSGKTEPREGLVTVVYKLVKQRSAEAQELFKEVALEEDSDFERD